MTDMKKFRISKHQPCCGYFLQGGVRAVALIDIGVSLFACFLIASEISQKWGEWNKSKEDDETAYYIRGVLWASYFAHFIIIIGISLFLFKNAKKRNDKMCKLWMIISSIVNLAIFVEAIVNEIMFKIGRIVAVFAVLYILYKLYCIYVVHSFIKEIQSYGAFNNCLKGLSDKEVEEFEKGHPPEANEVKDQLELVKKQAFNQDFEIAMNKLRIEEDVPLGSGAFGTVYRAKYYGEDPPRAVAVKTVNPSADPSYFKTLLGELKIMTFLSPNDNVVNLIGACTSEIKQKRLYIVVEFCPYGNLHDFLKARRGLFVNFVKDGVLTGSNGNNLYKNVNPSNTITTLNLIQWAYQTAKGMEFLENKKVIHGDLAARNVLLAYGKIAKITDFGLSRKLYQYTNYVSKQDKLLPWRWMSYESLRDMTFSSKSDVWSYGITLWEIFSLGEIPFPGGFTWNADFLTQLLNGMRMTQPPNATNEIYDLMVKTWDLDPESRPNFQEIGKFFEQTFEEVAQKDEPLDNLKDVNSDTAIPTVASRYSVCSISSMTNKSHEKVLEEVEVYIANPTLINTNNCLKDAEPIKNISKRGSIKTQSDLIEDYGPTYSTYV